MSDEKKGANPKEAFGQQKPQLHLVPPILEITAAQALGEGAAKYGAYNWRKSAALSMNTYLGAIKRHLAAFMDGEEIDPESTTGKTHLSGIVACVAIILDARAIGNMVDDRAPPGPAADLLRAPGYKKPAPPELVNIGEEDVIERIEDATKSERLTSMPFKTGVAGGEDPSRVLTPR